MAGWLVADLDVESRQVFDLPPVASEVAEHQIVSKRCGCGHVTIGDGQIPEHVKAPVQYRPRVASVIVYL